MCGELLIRLTMVIILQYITNIKSLYCRSETNTMLYVNYSSILKHI